MRYTETDIVRGCLELLRLRGVFAWRNNTGKARIKGQWVSFGKRGASDILGLLPDNGRMLCVECKMPKGRQTLVQAAFQQEIEAHGGVYLLVRSVGELDDMLAAVGVE